MKVLQVIDRLEAGGAERVFLDMTQLLLDKAIKVDTMTISGKGVLYDSIDERANHYFLDRKNKFSLKKILECAKLCANYDIVHVHMRHSYTYVRLAQIVSRKNFKIIFHDHFTLNKVPLSLMFFFKPKYYIGVCEHNVNWAKEKVGINKKHVFLLRNTIIPKVINKQVDRESWLLVSNIRPIKNIEFAIDLATRHHAKLAIFGNYSDIEYKNKIKEKLKNNSDITILENVFDVQSNIGGYSFALHTSFSETGPLVLLEYLAQGIPFLSYKVGEVSNILFEKLPHFFIDNFDTEAWINRIKEDKYSINKPEELKEIFEKYFGPNKYIFNCMEIYKKIMLN